MADKAAFGAFSAFYQFVRPKILNTLWKLYIIKIFISNGNFLLPKIYFNMYV